MAARQIIVPGAMPARDANGRVLPSKFRFYLPGTTTPASVYTDSGLGTPHAFPILSDSAGRWPGIWADDANSFDVGWTDQVYDQVIDTFANISPLVDGVLASVGLADSAAAEAALSAAEAASYAAAAAAGASGLDLYATSNTTVAIGNGTKVFTLNQADKDYAFGQWVSMTSIAASANYMVGQVQSYVGNILTVLVSNNNYAGSGSPSSWGIALTPALSADRLTALEAEQARLKGRRRLLFREFL